MARPLPALLLFVGALQACAQQQEAPLIPRERFFTFTERNTITASPDLDRVYFREGPDSVVHVWSTGTNAPLEDLAFPAPVLAFTPTKDGLLAAYRQGEGLHLEHRTGSGSTAIALPAGCERLRFVTTAVGRPERHLLELVCADSTVTGFHVLDLEAGTLVRRYAPQAPGQLQFDGDLRLVAGTARSSSAGNTLMLYHEAQDRWDTLRAHPWTPDHFLGGFSSVVSVSADGGSVYFTSNAEVDKARLYRYDRATGDTTELARDERADMLPFGLSFDARHRPTSAVALYAATRRHVVDPTWRTDLDRVAGMLNGDLSFIASSSDDRRWLVRELTGGPSRILLFDRTSGELRFLFSEQPELAGERLATRHARTIRSFDGTQLPAHVYLPAGSDADGDGVPDRPLPTVIYVHGGPWAGISQWNVPFFWRNFQFLADRGHAVINAEFRGTTGLGKHLTDLGDKAWRSGMVEDQASVARWAVAEGIAQEGSIALWGWSFGGYATMAGLAFHPELYAAGIAMYGISDQEAFGRLPFADNPLWHARVGNPADANDLELLRAGSPLRHVDDIRAPLFLTTGSQDQRVPQDQMDRMAEALVEANKPVVYSVYPEEGHDYRAPESWISFWAGAEQFLAQHLGGRAQPAGADIHLGGVEWKEGLGSLTR